jgi:hypothetical protein
MVLLDLPGAGLEKITSGTISIGGRVVNELEPKDRGDSDGLSELALGCPLI